MIKLKLPNIAFPDVTKQAISKARQNIHPYLFRDLFNLSVDAFYQNIDARKTWNGYHLFAIDGSKIELPNSQSNFEHFGEMFGYPDSNRKFTMALASVVYDVLDDYIVHASIERYLAGVIRLRENYKMTKNCKGDTIAILPCNTKNKTEDIEVRVVEVTLDDGSKEYHELKSFLKLEEFNGATPTSVIQEFYINLLLANLASLLKNHVDDQISASANPANKYRYQANRSFIIGQLKYCLIRYLCDQFEIIIFDDLISAAYKNRSQIQPGRSFPRKKNKAIGRTHFRNKKVAF